MLVEALSQLCAACFDILCEKKRNCWEKASRAELNVEKEVGKSHCNYQQKEDKKKQYYLRLQNSTIVGCFNN